MRWRTRRRSSNIEDRRGMRPAGGVKLGGSIGTIVIILAALYFGFDPRPLLQIVDTAPSPQQQRAPTGAPQNDPTAEFVAVVLADTEDIWNQLFREAGTRYREPTLVLFTGAVQSACGMANSAVGPFYCPGDNQVYIDLEFFRDLQDRFGAPGDFAQAYVIAHEVAHHVQNELGISGQVQRLRRQVSETESNALSVRTELQADCLSGVWAHHAERAKQILERGDIEEALNAASAIGDDRLQKQSRGYVTPDSFTHGSSEQRVRWFRKGLETGDLNACDTFSDASL